MPTQVRTLHPPPARNRPLTCGNRPAQGPFCCVRWCPANYGDLRMSVSTTCRSSRGDTAPLVVVWTASDLVRQPDFLARQSVDLFSEGVRPLVAHNDSCRAGPIPVESSRPRGQIGADRAGQIGRRGRWRSLARTSRDLAEAYAATVAFIAERPYTELPTDGASRTKVTA